jgi:membrane fusion protein (multidrug efflux system)
LLAAAALTGGTAWFFSLGKESTDDAQVEGHVLSIAAHISGQVSRVLIKDNQVVGAGQVLVELDRNELEARKDLARAELESAKAQHELAQAQLVLTDRNAGAGLRQARGGVSQAASTVASSKAQLDQAKADLAAAESRFKLTGLELDRARNLVARSSIAQAELDLRQSTHDQAKAGLDQAQARLESTKAGIAGGYAGIEQAQGRLVAAETAPQQVQAARAQVELASARQKQFEASFRLAELNLSYATIRSPVRGVVARRTVEVGQMVSPDRPLLAVVPLEDVWVVANFKESQIGAMREGQPATVEVDAYPGKKFQGHVDSLAAGTGARFALLPPDNASGNFVKVVQRVPVLVRIDDLLGLDLRPGMSVDVTVRVQ